MHNPSQSRAAVNSSQLPPSNLRTALTHQLFCSSGPSCTGFLPEACAVNEVASCFPRYQVTWPEQSRAEQTQVGSKSGHSAFRRSSCLLPDSQMSVSQMAAIQMNPHHSTPAPTSPKQLLETSAKHTIAFHNPFLSQLLSHPHREGQD